MRTLMTENKDNQPDAGNTKNIDDLLEEVPEDDDIHDRIALVKTEQPAELRDAPNTEQPPRP